MHAAGVYAHEETITAVYADWYPYTFEENGEVKGFEIEILCTLMGEMHISVDFQNRPWIRCLKMMQEGKADAVVSLLKTPERETFVYFPQESISTSKSCLFTKAADTSVDFNGSLESLKPYTIGVIAGFSFGSEFDHAHYLQKDEFRNAEMLIKKVLCGRNVLGAENKAVVIAVARRLSVLNQIRFLDPPIHAQRLYVGFAKTGRVAELADRFSSSLRSFKKTETYKRILETYALTPSDMSSD